MENKIGEIVALPPYDTEARVVEVSNVSCEGCYYHDQEYLCTGTDAMVYSESVGGSAGKTART